MKKLILYGISLCFLIIAFIFLNKENDCPQDLYKLNDSIYLEKVDYFSHYRIIEKSEKDYKRIVDLVSKIGVENEKIVYQLDSDKKYYILTKNTEIVVFKDLPRLKETYSISNLKLTSPWQFIEGYKKTDFKKTVREIVTIAIIVQLTLIFLVFIKYLKTAKT